MRDNKTDYHHVIPKTLFSKFPLEATTQLNKLQISVERKDHDLIEATNAPLIYLLSNGIPETEEQFNKFIAYSSQYLEPYNSQLRENQLCPILCKCGFETVINPLSRNTKYCRNCGEPIYNVLNDAVKPEGG